jgi:ABC-type multidrug transport system fused ATPase/permease subunit
VLVGFINLWDPQAWGYAETVVLFAAVIIGGLGNHRGAMLGAILVPVAFEEATRYIPPVPGDPNLVPALQWVVIGLLILVFLWFRPQGILPERRRRLATRQPPSDEPVAEPADGTAPSASFSAVPGRRELVPAPHEPPILECRDLSRSFDGVRAVDGVSMAFQPGRLTGIIGPNGAGKSTVLAMLAGTLPSSGGQILLKGEDVTGLPAYRRARQGLVRTFQLASEFKRLTVLENLVTAIPEQRGESVSGALRGRRYWAPRSAKRSRAPRSPWSASGCSPSPTATPATSAAASGGWWRSCAR